MKKGIVFILLFMGMVIFASGTQDENEYYNGYGMMGSGSSMMGGYSNYQGDGERLDMVSVKGLVEEYLDNIKGYDLSIAEIMEFHQNFYIEVAEINSDILFQELLVDPYSGAIYPEHGPNMMWNPSRSHMMGGYSSRNPKELTVSETEAIEYAGEYLKVDLPGTAPEDHADKFNGYYTIHVLKDDNIIGMLSVNGYSGQVWYHNWHGEFLGMKEID
ncbi:MAG: hypothetical protein PF518_14520 [Spirochaetaceae bacterium]|nr:hypothetical protein [Spirochaetaceae bacterium]